MRYYVTILCFIIKLLLLCMTQNTKDTRLDFLASSVAVCWNLSGTCWNVTSTSILGLKCFLETILTYLPIMLQVESVFSS